MAGQLPKFLSMGDNGDSIIYNQENSTFVFYIPKVFFNDTTKNPIAQVEGEYVTTIGLMNWAIIDEHGKRGDVKLFNYPTMIMCKPYEIEDIKDYSLVGEEPTDYRMLKFKKGDEIISQTRVPVLVDNVEMFFTMLFMTAKVSKSIPYDKIWEIFLKNAALNGVKYKLNIQLIGVLISLVYRDPKNTAQLFRNSDMRSMLAYSMMSLKQVPKFISPYSSIVSEGFDQAFMAASLMKDVPEDEIPDSPLEKVIMQ